MLRKLIDALADGLALSNDKGMLALVNKPTDNMFGYEPGELIGRPVETLIPVGLPSITSQSPRCLRASTNDPADGARARLVGLRKDGATFPVEISLSPVSAATGQFTLAVIRDITAARQHDDLIHLARAAAAEQGPPVISRRQ